MDYQYRGLVNSSKKRRIDKENELIKKVGNIYDYLYKEYIENIRSTDSIAKELGCARSYVTKLIKRNGIELRGKGTTNIGKKHPMSEEQKQRLKKIFSNPEVKKRRSEAQKRVWANLSKEERIKRVTPGNNVRTKRAMEIRISSIEIKVKEQLDFYGIRYIQQKQVYDIENGKSFYLDFYVPKYKLVIECNGDYWHNLPNRIKRDEMLKEFIESKNRKIVFIWEHEIKDDWFCILDYIKEGC
jgi:very-short-patch-repair endonuclease